MTAYQRKRIARNIERFFLTEEADIERATKHSAPLAVLKKKYAALKSKIQNRP